VDDRKAFHEALAMLRRAQIFLLMAIIPAVVSYTRISETAIPWAKLTILILLGFSAISILFSMFEEETEEEMESEAGLERVPPSA
jgi:uncharacterized membrane protein YtjA (UPF0391 family)